VVLDVELLLLRGGRDCCSSWAPDFRGRGSISSIEEWELALLTGRSSGVETTPMGDMGLALLLQTSLGTRINRSSEF
jgi:hypothetical protein